MKLISHHVFNLLKSKWGKPVILTLSIAIVYLDYITTRDIRLIMLAVIPVSFASLAGFMRIAYTLAIIMPLSRLIFFVPWEQMANVRIGIINATIRTIVLIIVIYYSKKVAKFYTIQQELEILKLKKVINQLECVLPICSSCRKVRTNEGEYIPLESYITQRTDSICSHGLCDECTKKLYPELF